MQDSQMLELPAAFVFGDGGEATILPATSAHSVKWWAISR
jgi:hypothetical protein